MWLQVEQFLYAARSWLHDAGLLDLFCLMLCCLICPASCYAAIWFDLHSARLLDLPNRMLCFGCSLFHVMLFDLVIKALRCLILSNSCATFLTFPCFVVSCSLHHVKFLFLKPGLHDAFSTSCYAPWPSLPHVMLLNVLCIMPCYVANEFNDLISAPTFVLETTSFSRLASAASLVTHFWFQNPPPRYGPGQSNFNVFPRNAPHT